MKIRDDVKTALFCAGLALSSLVAGCASETQDAQSILKSGSTQKNAANSGAIEVLLSNDFNILPNPVFNPTVQVSSPQVAVVVNSTNTTVPVNSTGPANQGIVANDPNNNNTPIPTQAPSSVGAGNLVLTVNDTGVFVPSGQVNNASLAGVNTSTATVWTATTPDHKFAYTFSGVQTYPQTINSTAPGADANTTAALNIVAAKASGTANATVTVNATALPIFQRGFFGENQIRTFRTSEIGVFSLPPFFLSINNFSLNNSFTYGIVHPSGSFLYAFGDVLSAGQAGTLTSAVEQPPAQDRIVIDPNNRTIVTANNATTVQFFTKTFSSNSTIGNRGFIQIYSINRATGELTQIGGLSLPAGMATPRHAVFGPNGSDLFVSAYSVANGSTVANNGAVLHYALDRAVVGNSTVLTGTLGAGPTETFLVGRGAMGLAFSQGFRRLYVACQLDSVSLTGAGSLGVPTGVSGGGSVRAFKVDANTGNLTREPANDLVVPAGGDAVNGVGVNATLNFPGFISANPVLDVLYVANSGPVPNLQTDIEQPSIDPDTGTVASIVVNSTIVGGGNLTRIGLTKGITNRDNYRTINADPSGALVFTQSTASPVLYKLGALTASAEKKGIQTGGFTVFKVLGNAALSAIGQAVVQTTPVFPISSDLYLVPPQAPTQ